ncbi:MAG: ceramidase domain-containing protein [Thermodesulfovibrionales bacterium]
MNPHSPGTRIVIGVSVASVLAMTLLPAIPQDPSYHAFADRRSVAGIPNFLDVSSNILLLASGLWGMFSLRRGACFFLSDREKIPYLMFFVGVALTGPGSAWYHLAPGNFGLFWDRLPMAVAFMALLAAVINERISDTAGKIMLPPLVSFGIFSVIFWYLGELTGRGDLRFYAFAQFYPMLAIPLLLVLFPPRYSRQEDFGVVFVWYLLAKLCEVLDSRIYGLGGVVSGHTLKHLFAAAAVFTLVRMLARRRPARTP